MLLLCFHYAHVIYVIIMNQPLTWNMFMALVEKEHVPADGTTKAESALWGDADYTTRLKVPCQVMLMHNMVLLKLKHLLLLRLNLLLSF